MSVLRKEVWGSMGRCGKDLSWIRVVREAEGWHSRAAGWGLDLNVAEHSTSVC